MYCTNCGSQMEATARFCAQCGRQAAGPAPEPSFHNPRPRLTRDLANKKIAGVCAGIARHYGWDVTLIRVAFLAAIVLHGLGAVAYLVGWACMPRSDESTYPPPQPAS